MSSQHELEKLLTDLVVIWPADKPNPAVEAARDYLHRNGRFGVKTHSVERSASSLEDSRFEILTEQWYSV